jgi:NTP pyrophosphatase (non-canonical NTP hydrolase)
VEHYPATMNDRTVEAHSDNKRWFPHRADNIVHHALGLCTEAGEAGDVIKKLDRGSLTLESARGPLASELADVLVYVFSLASIAGIDLEQAYDEKRKFNEERFGKKVPA